MQYQKLSTRESGIGRDEVESNIRFESKHSTVILCYTIQCYTILYYTICAYIMLLYFTAMRLLCASCTLLDLSPSIALCYDSLCDLCTLFDLSPSTMHRNSWMGLHLGWTLCKLSAAHLQALCINCCKWASPFTTCPSLFADSPRLHLVQASHLQMG